MTEINHVIPQLAEAPSFGSPQADIFNRLLQERIVVLGTDVNDGIANYITAQLLYLEGQDAGHVWRTSPKRKKNIKKYRPPQQKKSKKSKKSKNMILHPIFFLLNFF